jgi:protein tyrosine phosphatase (PTP) superfamily phosphohydrolase (DUF442 family)
MIDSIRHCGRNRRWLVALVAILAVSCSRARLCSRPPRARVPLPPAPPQQFAPSIPPEIPLTPAPDSGAVIRPGASYGPAPDVSVAPPGSTGYSTDIRYPRSSESQLKRIPLTQESISRGTVAQGGRRATTAVVPTREPSTHEPTPVPMPGRRRNGAATQPAKPQKTPPAAAPREPAPPTTEPPADSIPRYRDGIEPNLATGGQPTLEGLRWLKERGFRTVLNLLPDDDADPAEPGTVRESGMEYISLPVPAGPLTREIVDRFNQIADDAALRPLFIHDSTGTPGSRTAALWYLHRVLVDKASDESARRQAAEIGLSDADTELWLVIQGYLSEYKSKSDE